MSDRWPNMNCSEMEASVRTYFDEPVPAFILQTELRRWLSGATREIAQKANSIRRILTAQTTPGNREVAADAYKVHHVEYVPLSGPSLMLRKITPLQVGHGLVEGSLPQCWYEYGAHIGIEPVPTATHMLRLYCSDRPKLQHTPWPFVNFATGWTQTTGASRWTNNVFLGTALHETRGMELNEVLMPRTNYSVQFTLAPISQAGVTVRAGSTESQEITTSGIHTVTLTSSAVAPRLAIWGRDLRAGGGGTLTISNIYIVKEADFDQPGDQTELGAAWQHLAVLLATAKALGKDRRTGPQVMLEQIVAGEIEYLRQNIVENIPDGRNALKYG